MSLHAGSWACMQVHELACTSLSLHAIPWACIQFPKLSWSSMRLYAVIFFVWAARKNFTVLVYLFLILLKLLHCSKILWSVGVGVAHVILASGSGDWDLNLGLTIIIIPDIWRQTRNKWIFSRSWTFPWPGPAAPPGRAWGGRERGGGRLGGAQAVGGAGCVKSEVLILRWQHDGGGGAPSSNVKMSVSR